ncbi:MAG: hypothetical protein QHH09_00040 [Microgenomates group bacterium]|nr:hypothetical protein [Microgenomates group bacterium]
MEARRREDETYLLHQTDRERRQMVGQEFFDWLKKAGYDQVVYQGNIEDALPEAVRPALTAHGAPPSAYQGRMIGISTALIPQFPRGVILDEPLLPAEQQFWQELWKNLGIPSPTIIIGDYSQQQPGVFYYPFIGSNNFYETHKGNSLPPAEKFNNKARMRKLLREISLSGNIVPGIEIFYQGQELSDYVDLIYQEVAKYSRESDKRLLIKLGNTASGLLNVRVNPDMVAVNDLELQLRIKEQIYAMFQSPYDGELYPGDVVVEEVIDFGQQEDGWGDFSLRGFILPSGELVFFSVGRVISDQNGQYLGMVMVESTSEEQLTQIGLTKEKLLSVIDTSRRISQKMYQFGYFGPYSIDFFSPQDPTNQTFLIHDYNMREGGTTISGLASSVSGMIFGEMTAVLDIELKLKSKGGLLNKALNQLVAQLQATRMFPYATTFLNYPQQEKTGKIYTVKLLLPYQGTALTDDEVADYIKRVVDGLNCRLPESSISFRSPLQASLQK